MLFNFEKNQFEKLTDIEWRVIYVGSAESSSHDQVLDELLVGPVPVGINKFILQTDAPDPSLIPESDKLGITVILVTCSYKEQEFARIGYYVNNEYRPFEGYNVEEHGSPDLQNLDLTKVYRNIVADKPRVTRFPIKWSGIENSSSSEMEVEDDEEEEQCQNKMDMEEGENNANLQSHVAGNMHNPDAFLSPTKPEIQSSQNIVSPDFHTKNGIMGM